MIAHDPLPRSGRAALPHPAPALGDDAQTDEGIRMADARRRKPPNDNALHSGPSQVVPLAATAQDRPPQERDFLPESAQGRTIHGHPVIAGVAQDDRAQVGALLRDGRVQALPQFGFHRPQLGPDGVTGVITFNFDADVAPPTPCPSGPPELKPAACLRQRRHPSASHVAIVGRWTSRALKSQLSKLESLL